MTDAEAVGTIESVDPGLLSTPAYGPPPLPSGAVIDGYVGDRGERVKLADGTRALADSLLPITAKNSSGKVAPVDLSLVGDAGGWSPANPLAQIEIPSKLDVGVRLARSGVVLTPVDASGVPLVGGAAVVNAAAVTFPNTQTDADTVIKPVAMGVEASTVLRSAASPQALYYYLGLPAGTTLVPSTGVADGFDVVTGSGTRVAVVAPPVAVDAAGRAVPVTVTRSGDTLVVSVPHAHAGLEYPVTVDPVVTDSWTMTADAGWWTPWASSPGIFCFPSMPANQGLQVVDPCAPGQPYNSFPAYTAAAWNYTTQGASRIIALQAGTDQSLNAGMGMYEGIYLASGAAQNWAWLPNGQASAMTTPWTSYPGLGICAYSDCGDDNQSANGNHVSVVSLATQANNTASTTVTAASVWIAQTAAPQAQFTDLPQYWTDSSSDPVAMQAQDPGIGLSAYSLSDLSYGGWSGAIGAYGNGAMPYTSCIGVQCLSGQWTPTIYSAIANMPSGPQTLQACGLDDVVGSGCATATIGVDSSPPVVSFPTTANPLYQASLNGGALIGDTPKQLTVSVADGSSSAPQSGPAQVAITVDGQPVNPSGVTYSSGSSSVCRAPGPPEQGMPGCYSGNAYWTMYPEQYGAGSHKVTVTAYDWAYPTPNQTSQSFTVFVNHAAHASIGPGSVNLSTGELSLGSTDVSLSGFGNGLTVQRAYRSRNGAPAGGLGAGWSLSVPAGQSGGDFASLAPLPGGSVSATDGSGNQETFTASGGGFTSPPGSADLKLTQTSTSGGQIGEYPTKTPSSAPWGITAGPDGAVWFTENATSRIGRIVPSSYADSSGNGYVAGSYGVVTNGQAGPFSGALSAGFGGNSSAFTSQTPLSGTSNWTLEAWINPANLNQQGMAVYAGDQGGEGPGSSPPANGYGFGIFGSGGNTNGGCLTGLYEGVTWLNTGWCKFTVGQWYDIVEVNSGGTVSFYVNGSTTPVYTVTPSAPPAAPSGLFIGGYNGALYGGPGPRYFNGKISNVAFYPAALSTTRIAAHYAATSSQPAYAAAVQADSPAAYYELNEPATQSDWALPAGSHPNEITTGADGNLWFTENGSGQIGKITPSGAITHYAIPTGGSTPIGIAAGPPGTNALWFTEFGTDKIGQITTAGTIFEYQIPTPNSEPGGITLGPDGALWFTEWGASKIGRIPLTATPSNPQITEYPTPTPNAAPTVITAGSDGALWFTESNAVDQIGRIATTATTGPASYADSSGHLPANPASTNGYVPNGVSGPMAGSTAVTFNGASSITSTTTPVTGPNWTLEAWVKPTSTNQTGMVIITATRPASAAPPTGTASASSATVATRVVTV